MGGNESGRPGVGLRCYPAANEMRFCGITGGHSWQVLSGVFWKEGNAVGGLAGVDAKEISTECGITTAEMRSTLR